MTIKCRDFQLGEEIKHQLSLFPLNPAWLTLPPQTKTILKK